jgi:hypothetical protein
MSRFDELKSKLILLVEQIVHLNGKEKRAVVDEYFELVNEYSHKCFSVKPIYVKRS